MAVVSRDEQHGSVATKRPYKDATKWIVVALPDATGPTRVEGTQADADTARLQTRRILSVMQTIGNVLNPAA
jgi:hypothetical protein